MAKANGMEKGGGEVERGSVQVQKALLPSPLFPLLYMGETMLASACMVSYLVPILVIIGDNGYNW